MKKDFRPIILAKDGCKSAAHLLSELTLTMSQPGMRKLVGMIKLNDGLLKSDMSAPAIAHGLRAVCETTGAAYGSFIDTKTGDVSGTLENYGECFNNFPFTNILTVNALIATQGFLEFRKALPGTSLALFSVPTDISEEECVRRHGIPPAEKIAKDVMFYTSEWERVCKKNNIEKKGVFAKPFDIVVAAPGDLEYLNSQKLNLIFDWLTPNIRDMWMHNDHQDAKRGMGVYQALVHGARHVVMGTQLLKGNPAEGISPEESQRRTLAEIERFKKDFLIG